MNALRLSLLASIVAWGILVPQALAIVGGEEDTENAYANVGAVVYAPEGAAPGPRFSGILIRPTVFLTAGHAIRQFVRNHPEPFTDCYVSFGPDVRTPKVSRKIVEVKVHPDYKPSGYGPDRNDVGIIILDEPIDDITPAELPPAGFLDGLEAAGLLRDPAQGEALFTVVGYGSTLDFPPPQLTPGDGPRRYAETEFLALTKGWLFTLQNPATGNGGTEYGDSGGPTFWERDGNTRVLVALTSGGDTAGVAVNIPWRVDTPETLDWLYSVLPSGP